MDALSTVLAAVSPVNVLVVPGLQAVAFLVDLARTDCSGGAAARARAGANADNAAVATLALTAMAPFAALATLGLAGVGGVVTGAVASMTGAANGALKDVAANRAPSLATLLSMLSAAAALASAAQATGSSGSVDVGAVKAYLSAGSKAADTANKLAPARKKRDDKIFAVGAPCLKRVSKGVPAAMRRSIAMSLCLADAEKKRKADAAKKKENAVNDADKAKRRAIAKAQMKAVMDAQMKLNMAAARAARAAGVQSEYEMELAAKGLTPYGTRGGMLGGLGGVPPVALLGGAALLAFVLLKK